MLDQERDLQTQPRTFSKEEKVALILLIFAGIGGLFFGMKYLGKNLEAPFAFTYEGEGILTSDEEEAKEITDMKNRDTDEDSLNDYDEIYVYKTSAYLADSDSDGKDDATELVAGDDPNCPQGKECLQTVAVGDDTVSGLLGGDTTEPTFDLEAAQAALDQSTGVAGTGTVDGSGVTGTTIPDEIKNMTPEELRALLLQNGIEQSMLDQLSDEELMKMFGEILDQYQSGQ